MILVTGGCGFIGAALVKALVREREQVRVYDSMWRGSKERLSDVDVEIFDGDIRDDASVIKAAEGCDEIIHLACINGTENFYKYPDRVLDVGIRGMQSVMDAIATHGIRQLVLASSSEVYQTPSIVPTPEMVPMVIPDPYNPRYSYAAVKIISELQALYSCSAPRVLIARPHNIYGPDMGHEHVIPQLARRIVSEDELEFQGDAPGYGPTGNRTFYGGEQTRAFCYIDDCVDQFMTIRKRGEHKGIYNVGTEEETSIIDLARMIANKWGKSIRVYTGGKGDGGALRRCPDMSMMVKMGYQGPKIPLQHGLEMTLAWYWNQGRENDLSILRS